MTQRERVIDAVRHKDTGYIPYQLDLVKSVHDALAEYYGDPDFLYTKVNNHMIRGFNSVKTQLNELDYADHFGVVWRRREADGGDIGMVKEFTLPEPALEGYTFPRPDPEMIKRKCEYNLTNHPELFNIYEIGFSLYERAWSLRGMENLLMDFAINEHFVDELLDKILEYNLGVIDLAAQYPIDCIFLGDDWGQQRGLIFGYKHWKRFIYPRIKAMYERIHAHGKLIAQHSCGDNYELFGDLIGIGLDIYNTFQPEIYDMTRFKREFGKDLTIYGGISTQGVLSQGTAEEVYDATRRAMETMGKGGGYIAAPTHSITPDVSADNIMAFLRAVKEQ